MAKYRFRAGENDVFPLGHEYKTDYMREAPYWRTGGAPFDPCVYCGEVPICGRSNSRDHIIPRSILKGVELDMNIAPACLRCNVAKDNMTLLQYLLQRAT